MDGLPGYGWRSPAQPRQPKPATERVHVLVVICDEHYLLQVFAKVSQCSRRLHRQFHEFNVASVNAYVYDRVLSVSYSHDLRVKCQPQCRKADGSGLSC